MISTLNSWIDSVHPRTAASVLVARKALDQQKQQGEQTVALIDSATAPSGNGVGQHINVTG